MTARCLIQKQPDCVVIRISPERSVWSLLYLLFIFLAPTIYGLGWAGFFLWGLLGYVAWRFAWNLFGVEEIAADREALTVTKRLLFWYKTRRCSCGDIDWIAYHPSAYRSPAGIGILLKDKMNPFGIGFDLEPADAESILQALKSIAGLGAKARGTTELSWYKLA
jgi:hypothetical protein